MTTTIDHVVNQLREMDDRWCDRFSKQEEILNRVDVAIRGDGKRYPGLMADVRELQKGVKGRARILWAIFAAGIASGVAAAFAAVGRLFHTGS